MLTQNHPHNIPDSLTTRYNLDLAKVDLVSEDMLIRQRRIAVARPLRRYAERLAAIAARLEREAR